MADYTHEYSAFPDSLIAMKTFKDVTDDIASIVADIEEAKSEGDFAAAVQIINAHPELSDYNFSTADVNKIIEEIRNTQIYTKNNADAIKYGSTYLNGRVGDVWIGDPLPEQVVSAPRMRKSANASDNLFYVPSESFESTLYITDSFDNKLIPENENSIINIDNTDATYIYTVRLSIVIKFNGTAQKKKDLLKKQENTGIIVTLVGERADGSTLVIGTRRISSDSIDYKENTYDFSFASMNEGIIKIYPKFEIADYTPSENYPNVFGFDISYKNIDFNVHMTITTQD